MWKKLRQMWKSLFKKDKRPPQAEEGEGDTETEKNNI
ncbi:hypothetical protein SAMN05518683_110147 [Salibacterium halotolerans]|uniref:Uncharacterized protein n=1 Tax=Salibacterium halotolerans TaxID=1884432 RepID=A0A1I5TG65_9BACI|nr:hypothetical protein SAMN05518683_110147 [Salibacterium halotolerans]